MSKGKILIVDDDESIVFAFGETLESEGYQMLSAESGYGCLEKLEEEKPDVLFLDIAMPGMSGLETLKKIKEKEIDVPVIVITGFGTMETAIRAVQLGAYEYITKPLDVEKLRITARRALEMQRLKQEIRGLRHRLDHRYAAHTLIGNDPAMQEVYKTIGAVTMTGNNSTVLIQGESGTGKELVARAIHNNSGNAEEPFITINCTALAEDLLESELFGHERGSFTGAFERKTGKLELAGKGTLFFDEVGDMTPKLQQKLLRLLQEREFERVGGNEILKVEARFIAATNRDLESQMKRGRFREDLFFRLNVISIHLPPLRNRKGDISLLAGHFLAKCNAKLNKEIKAISDDVLEILMDYDFPGNVRELENIVEHCVALTQAPIILPESLPNYLRKKSDEEMFGLPITSFELRKARRDVVAAFERKFLQEILKATKGRVGEAAKMAKIERQSFQRLMKRNNVRARDFR